MHFIGTLACCSCPPSLRPQDTTYVRPSVEELYPLIRDEPLLLAASWKYRLTNSIWRASLKCNFVVSTKTYFGVPVPTVIQVVLGLFTGHVLHCPGSCTNCHIGHFQLAISRYLISRLRFLIRNGLWAALGSRLVQLSAMLSPVPLQRPQRLQLSIGHRYFPQPENDVCVYCGLLVVGVSGLTYKAQVTVVGTLSEIILSYAYMARKLPLDITNIAA